MFAPIAGTTGVIDFAVPSQTGSAVPELKSSGGVSSEQDKQSFAALMEPVGAAGAATSVPSQHGPTALSGLEKFATMQKMEMQDNLQSLREFSAAAPYLSMAESTAFGIEMTAKMSVTAAQLKVASGVGKGTGKGIDALMRNQ